MTMAMAMTMAIAMAIMATLVMAWTGTTKAGAKVGEMAKL